MSVVKENEENITLVAVCADMFTGSPSLDDSSQAGIQKVEVHRWKLLISSSVDDSAGVGASFTLTHTPGESRMSPFGMFWISSCLWINR